MKMVRSLFLSVILLSTVSLHTIVDLDWEVPVPGTGLKILVKDKDWDYGVKYDYPVFVGSIKGKVTRKTVGKGLEVLKKSESEFLITQCLGNDLPTSYGWADIAGSRLAGVIAVLSGDQDLRKDLQEFYALKKKLSVITELNEKKEILKQCVILKHRIKEKLKEKKTVDKEVSK